MLDDDRGEERVVAARSEDLISRMLMWWLEDVVMMKLMMVVEDNSASSVKDMGVFLLFRRAQLESSIVFEESIQESQECTPKLRRGTRRGSKRVLCLQDTMRDCSRTVSCCPII